MLGDMIVYRVYEVYVLPGAFKFLGFSNDLQGSDGFLEDFIMLWRLCLMGVFCRGFLLVFLMCGSLWAESGCWLGCWVNKSRFSSQAQSS